MTRSANFRLLYYYLCPRVLPLLTKAELLQVSPKLHEMAYSISQRGDVTLIHEQLQLSLSPQHQSPPCRAHCVGHTTWYTLILPSRAMQRYSVNLKQDYKGPSRRSNKQCTYHQNLLCSIGPKGRLLENVVDPLVVYYLMITFFQFVISGVYMKVLTTCKNFHDAGLRSFSLNIFLHFNTLVFQFYFQFVLYSANMLNLFFNICIVSELYLLQMLLIKIKNICME